ncbi:MAG: hypothetical protein QOH80_173 [Actinomycetota bacterium]|nr:hypothetical protein [Actinomycetota bacterium]
MTKRPPYSPPRLAPWLLAVGVTLIAITGAVGALVVLTGVSPSDPCTGDASCGEEPWVFVLVGAALLAVASLTWLALSWASGRLGNAQFHAPPQWPAPPPGWRPHSAWRPDPLWPVPPEHWEYWRNP